MQIKKILFLLIILFTFQGFGQINSSKKKQNNVYTDYIRDERGKPIQGLIVRVRNSISHDKTDLNGKFTVTAKKGDEILIFREDKLIDSYIYDGSMDYFIRDDNYQDTSLDSQDLYSRALDSARFYVKKNPLIAISFIEDALKNTNTKKKIAKAYEVLGDANYALKQYDLARGNYLLAYDTFKKSNAIILKLARTNFKLQEFKKAKKYIEKILSSNKKTKEQEVQALELLGDINSIKANKSLAIQHYTKALEIAKKNYLDTKITKLNEKIAKNYAELGDVNLSKTYFDNSVASAKRKSKKEAIIQNNKAANFYEKNNNIDEEIKRRKINLKELKTLPLEIESEEDISPQKIKKDIGKALLKKQDYNQAISYLKESEKDAFTKQDIQTQKEAVEGLTEAYVALGDDKNALKNYKKYTKLVDLLYRKKESEIRRAIIVAKTLSEKQNRILSLEKDRELNQNKLKLIQTKQELISESSKRQKLVIYSLLIGLLLLLVALYFLIKSNKERTKSNNLLALKQLRSQMNPHFIFNALNSVNGFIATNDERAANKYLTDFSMLMRNVLDNSEKDFISLQKEIELLQVYLKLEHSRFKDKFDFTIEIDQKINLEDFKIPPMLLQPYVENAVWHGLRYKKEKGLLLIKVKKEDDNTIKIEIIDNGIGRKKSNELKSNNQLKHQSKGMKNISDRIKILNKIYPNTVSIKVMDLEQESGTKVILILKKNIKKG